ncbi:hypothetical protein [Flavobacterium psychrophilum]|uniref:hypothetical protein n=1 Tax=Flavobacterium psychrophilum TaxID=96345 RepID=UPI000A3B7F18|nr:hypothetical protein [Flavobacterium psychrophilum]
MIPVEAEFRFAKYKLESDDENKAILSQNRNLVLAEMEQIFMEILKIYDSEPISTSNRSLKLAILKFKASTSMFSVNFELNQEIKKQVQNLFLQQEHAVKTQNFVQADLISGEAIKLMAFSRKSLDFFL